jgi:hypothetical protein
MVHNQGEIGAILTNASSFGKASAFMQAANEESEEVLHEYYEKGLKFKYSDDKGIRSMIDLVYDTIDVPFGMQLGFMISANNTGAGWVGLGEGIAKETVASVYASEKDAYAAALRMTLEQFERLE